MTSAGDDIHQESIWNQAKHCIGGEINNCLKSLLPIFPSGTMCRPWMPTVSRAAQQLPNQKWNAIWGSPFTITGTI